MNDEQHLRFGLPLVEQMGDKQNLKTIFEEIFRYLYEKTFFEMNRIGRLFITNKW